MKNTENNNPKQEDGKEPTEIITNLTYGEFVNNHISLMEHRNKNGIIWIHRVKEIKQTNNILKNGVKITTITAIQQDGTEFEVKFFFDKDD